MHFAHWFTLGEGRGGGETHLQDYIQHSIGFHKHLIIPESQYAIPLRFEPGIAFGVLDV